jgi:hypothetical protein
VHYLDKDTLHEMEAVPPPSPESSTLPPRASAQEPAKITGPTPTAEAATTGKMVVFDRVRRLPKPT